jgi:hypothetical protein
VNSALSHTATLLFLKKKIPCIFTGLVSLLSEYPSYIKHLAAKYPLHQFSRFSHLKENSLWIICAFLFKNLQRRLGLAPLRNITEVLYGMNNKHWKHEVGVTRQLHASASLDWVKNSRVPIG